MARTGKHAVVIGASMSGLLAARALADYYEQVTVLERDRFPPGGGPRKGVPQGRHAHGLLSRGREVLESFFPGLTQELVAQGALTPDITRDALWFNEGNFQVRFASGMTGLLVSRPRLEAQVRTRLLALPNVRAIEGCDVLGLVTSPDLARVTGVNLRRSKEGEAEQMEADLVVDASGRGSRMPAWLEGMGYERPEEEEVRVGVRYATRVYRRTPEQLPGIQAVILAANPTHPRSGVLLAQEDGTWILTLIGYLGDQVPTDEAGFLAFARSLPTPKIYEVLKHAEPLSDPVAYNFAASQRYHYERLARFPEGLLVFGDAICSFNPTYGQGMTVAALEMDALHLCLSHGSAQLAPRFFKEASKVVDIPWSIAVGNDLRFPAVQGPRTGQVRFINWYMAKLLRAAWSDPVVALAFQQVANMMIPPPSVMSPAIALRVLRGNLRLAKSGQPRLAPAGATP